MKSNLLFTIAFSFCLPFIANSQSCPSPSNAWFITDFGVTDFAWSQPSGDCAVLYNEIWVGFPTNNPGGGEGTLYSPVYGTSLTTDPVPGDFAAYIRAVCDCDGDGMPDQEASATSGWSEMENDSPDPAVVLSMPEGGAIECDEPIPSIEYTWSGGWGGAFDVYSESVEVLDCMTIITYEVTVFTDVPGLNNVEGTTVWIIEDTTAPEVECTNPVYQFSAMSVDFVMPDLTGDVSVSDNCNDYELSQTPAAGEVMDSENFEVVFSAMDVCGNEGFCSALITIEPQDFSLSVSPSVTVSCDEEIPPFTYELGQSWGENVTVIESETMDQFDCETILNYSLVVSDEDGNSASAETQITIVDTAAPEFVTVPENMTVECGTNPEIPEILVSDNCDVEVEVSLEEIIFFNDCSSELLRTWTAVDACGNTASIMQTITLEDTTSPELLNLPSDAIVECGSIPEVADVVALDNCDEAVAISFNEETVINGCETYIIRTWSAVDICGNANEYMQTITAVDEIAPIIAGCPEEILIYDINELPFGLIDFSSLLDLSDNCSEVTTTQEPFVGSEHELGELSVTITAMDGCGNSTACTFLILIEDDFGIAEATIKSASVYPNPATDQITIELFPSTSSQEELSVYDGLGKLVVLKRIDGPKLKVDLRHLNEGVYYFLAKDEDGISQKGKFIKQTR